MSRGSWYQDNTNFSQISNGNATSVKWNHERTTSGVELDSGSLSHLTFLDLGLWLVNVGLTVQQENEGSRVAAFFVVNESGAPAFNEDSLGADHPFLEETEIRTLHISTVIEVVEDDDTQWGIFFKCFGDGTLQTRLLHSQAETYLDVVKVA